MPELPEVEVVRRTISKEVQGKTISEAEVYWPRMVSYPSVELFQKQIAGQSIGKIRRTGKYLRIEIGSALELVVNFRMTGKFKLLPPGDRFQKHVHVYFHLSGEPEGLAYHDVRKFGDVFLVPQNNYERIQGLHRAGVDPLVGEFTFPIFQSLIQARKRAIKALRLDQSVITGLGNYICDEILWFEDAPGVHPRRRSDTLTGSELKQMYQ